LGSRIAAGLDPAAQLSRAVYGGLYRLAAATPRRQVAPLHGGQARALRRALGAVPDAHASDGIVPTRSQVWGRIVHAARADHLDVIGHFHDPDRDPPHVDWLATGSGFDRRRFETLWADVARFVAG
jgi:hypothetical protein